jgi:hypothetical protein
LPSLLCDPGCLSAQGKFHILRKIIKQPRLRAALKCILSRFMSSESAEASITLVETILDCCVVVAPDGTASIRDTPQCRSLLEQARTAFLAMAENMPALPAAPVCT